MKDYRNIKTSRASRNLESRRCGLWQGWISRRFAKRLFSMLVVVCLTSNTLGLVVDDINATQNRLASAEILEINPEPFAFAEDMETDTPVADVYDDALDQLGDLSLSHNLTSNATGDEMTYAYKLEGETRLLLSDLIEKLKLPVRKLKDIQSVTLQNDVTNTGVDMSLFVSFTEVEDDYLIVMKPLFAEAKLTVYTIDGMFILRLVNDPTLTAEKVAKAARTLSENPDGFGPLFSCDLSDVPSEVRLSAVLERAGLPIMVKNVVDLGVIEHSGNEGQCLTIEKGKGDYRLTVVRSFNELELAVFTGSKSYTVVLQNGTAPGTEPIEFDISGGSLEIPSLDNVDLEDAASGDLIGVSGLDEEIGVDVGVDLDVEQIETPVSEVEPEQIEEPVSVSEAEAEEAPETESENEPEQEPEIELEVKPEQEPQTEPEQEPEVELAQEPEAEVDIELTEETETEPEAEPEQEPEVEPEVELAQEPEAEAEPEQAQEPEAESEPEQAQEPEAEAEPEQAQDSEAEAEVEQEPEAEAEVEQEPEAEAEVEQAQEPEAEAEVEQAQEPEAETEPEQAQEPEAEAEVGPEQGSEPETAEEPAQESEGGTESEAQQESGSEPEAAQDDAPEIVPEVGEGEENASEDAPMEESDNEADAAPTVEPEEQAGIESGIEAQSDDTAPESESAVSWPAAIFTERTSGVNVTVTADEGAFPEGTTMSVRRVWDADTLSDIRESVADDFVKVRRVQLVDIAFYDAAGNEIEPRVPVSVVISVSEINDDQSAVVVHMDDEGQTEIVAGADAESANGRTNVNVEIPAGDTKQDEVGIEQTEVDYDDGETAISFDADSFSLYAVVVTETISTHYIDASGKTYSVEVSYGPEAGIPSGATLSVSELTGEAAERYYNEALEAVENDGNNGENAGNGKKTTLKYAKALDISILMDGVEVRPVAPISVSIKLLDAPNSDEFDEANVVHFGDEAEVVESNIQQEAVRFETDGFSVYVVTYTLSTYYMDAAGNTFNIEVEYDREAGIPEGAELRVSEITGDDAEDYVARAAEALNVSDSQMTYAKALDIAIMKDGEEYTPATPVSASIKLLDAPEADANTNVNVLHFGDGVETVDCALNGNTVEFEADGFSVYVVTFTTTVSETERTYSFDTSVDESIALSALLTELGIEGIEIEGVDADHEVLSIVESDTDWTITPLKAFVRVPLTLTLRENAGTVTINVTSTAKPVVTITADSDSKTYDGSALTVSTWTYEGTLDEGDHIDTDSVTVTGTQTNAGSSDNVASGAIILDAAGENVTSKYDVQYVPGTLTVERAQVTVTADDKTKRYLAAEPEFTATVSGIVEGDAVAYNFSREPGQNVKDEYGDDAQYAITPSGDAVQGNYEVSFVSGKLTITPRTVHVTITGNHDIVAYDGQKHEVDGVSVTWIVDKLENEDQDTVNGYYGEGDYICDDSDAHAEMTDVGTGYMGLMKETFEFVNNNDNFNSVIDDVIDGYVTVTPQDQVIVTITGKNQEIDYDGAMHYVEGYNVAINNSAYSEDDISFTGSAYAERMDVGTTNMGLAAEQFINTNNNFNNVTFNVTDGFITVNPISAIVTITGEAVQAEYDSYEHTASGYEAEANTDLYDVTKDFTFNGTAAATRTDTGTTDMGLAAEQFINTNDNFNNVTFTVVDGSVTVTKAPVTVSINGKNVIEDYDGEEHSAEGYEADTDNGLYTKDDMTLQEGKEAKVSRTNAGTAYMDLQPEWFRNTNDNFDVTFEIIEDGFITIDPIETTVRITGKNGTAVFGRDDNGDPIIHRVTGFTAQADSRLYDVSYVNRDGCDYEDLIYGVEGCDFKYDGSYVAEGAEAGTYQMQLDASRFTNVNPNFSDVVFEIEKDGWLTIDPIVIITKALDDTRADGPQKFDFSALLKDDRGDRVKSYALSENPSVVTGENGDAAEFSLTTAHGDATPASITLRVPKDSELTVTEKPGEKVYQIGVEVDGYGAEEKSTETVTANKSETLIAFTNSTVKYCRINNVEFQTIQDAVQYAANPDNNLSNGLVVIEMLSDYTMPANDVVEIPAGLDVVLTTASDYMESGATITRSDALLAREKPMFANAGTLRLGDGNETGGITLNGGEGSFATPMIVNSGTLYVNANATVEEAQATVNGGAIRNAATGAVYINGGTLSDNRVTGTANGGAIYNEGSVSILDGALSGNRAANGGAIYDAEGSSLSVEGGVLTGNIATSYGGAVYSAGGRLSVSGGVIGSDPGSIENINEDLANTAQRGAAIYVASGVNNSFSGGRIAGNLVTNDGYGAVDVASDAVGLYFSGSAYIYMNALKTEQPEEQGDETQTGGEGEASENARNVCLSVDSELVINAQSLDSDAKIGIYVPGDLEDENSLYHKRGMSGDVFGSCSTDTRAEAFINDRLPSMMRSSKINKLVWGQPITVEVRYLAAFSAGAANLPPQMKGSVKKTYTDYYPAASENYVADIASDVRNSRTGHNLSTTAAFACAYAVSKKQDNETTQAKVDTQSFNQYVNTLVWDSANGTWNAVRKDPTDIVTNIERLVIYYSEPAYITISNNADITETDKTGSTLTITGLTVNGIDAKSADYLGYGLVIAKNGATQQHFPALTAADFTMAPGSSYKLLFPGALGKAFSFAGSFDKSHADEVEYEYKDKVHSTTSETGDTQGRKFMIEGTTFDDKTTSVKIQFGDAIPICQIVGSDGTKHEYTTLSEAFSDAVDYWNSDSYYTYENEGAEDQEKIVKIEMLTDYLIPDTDKPEITDNSTDGVHIVLTTASSYAEDTTETTRVEKYVEGAAEDAPKQYYTYKKCAKISRDQGNGNSFLKLQGKNTGGTPANLKTVLRIENMRFEGKGVASSNGGVLWVSDCDVTLKNIKCTDFKAEDGGAFFVGDSTGKDCSKLKVIGSYFANCASSGKNGHGGGAIRTAALELTMNDCVFRACTANENDAQGGGMFQWIRDGNNNRKSSSATVSDCLFENCETKGTGGGMELNSFKVTLNRCTFNECFSNRDTGNKGGGGFNIWLEFNSDKIVTDDCKLELNSCTFKNCHVKQHGGAFRVKTNNKSVASGFVYNITLNNTTFTGNSADVYGGAIWLTESKAKLVVDGCTFRGNTAKKEGGAIKSDHPIEIKNGTTFTANTSNTSGGGVWCNKDTTIDGCTFQGNTAAISGGGLYCTGALTIMGETSITGNELSGSAPANGAGIYYSNTLTLGKAAGTNETPDTDYDVITIKDNTVSGNQASNLWLGSNLPKVVNHLSGEIHISNGSDKVYAGNKLATTTDKTFDGLSDGDHVFLADIDDQLWGVMKRGSTIDVIWRTSPVCKITGEDGHILYFDEHKKEPAIFDELGDNTNDGGKTTSALGVLRYSSPALYDANGDPYPTYKTYYVKMLVPEYYYDIGDGKSASIRGGHTVVLTTASSDNTGNKEDGYTYPEDAADNAVIYRSGSGTGSMFCTRDSTHFILENITIDGASVEGTDPGSFINFKANASPIIELGKGSVVRNFDTQYSGGAFYFANGGTLKIDGGKIVDCHAGGAAKGTDIPALGGGAVCMNSNSAKVNIVSGSIEDCSCDTMGGAISQAKGTLEMSGGTIEDCSAGTYGGGVYVWNGQSMSMTPAYTEGSEDNATAKITGCSAGEGGGGIAVGGNSARLYFSGNAVVRNNALVTGEGDAATRTKNNVELSIASNEIIQVTNAGLGEDALIGVYVTGGEDESPYNGYGKRNDKFGRYAFNDNEESKLNALHLFVNDRNDLMGTGLDENSTKYIIWEVLQSVEISKTVDSDVQADANERFYFVVSVYDSNGQPVNINGTYGVGRSKMTFVNGVAKIGYKDGRVVSTDGLRSGEYKLAIGLPVASGEAAYRYVVQEVGGFEEDGEPKALSGDYITYTSVNGADKELAAAAEAQGFFLDTEGKETALIHRVAFTNERRKASLTISKTVESDIQADKNHTFSYTVELTGVVSGRTYAIAFKDANGNTITTVSGKTLPTSVTFEKGRATFDLAAGVASATITGLPSGVKYKVTQTAEKAVADGFNASYRVTAAGVIVADDMGWVVSDQTLAVDGEGGEVTNIVDFINEPKTGLLTIKKVVSGELASDKTKKFSFTVTLTGKEVSGDYAIKVGTQTVGQARFDYDASEQKSVATGIQVDSTQAVTIVGLPTEIRYKVEETPDSNFTTRSFGDSGTITTNESVATFINSRNMKGSLAIEKKVESDVKADKTRTYSFLIGCGDTLQNGDREWTKAASVTVAQSPKTITGLPTGIQYEVTETTKDAYIDSECTSGNASGADIASIGGSVVFRNTRAEGELRISNTVVSPLTADADTTFTYRLAMDLTDGDHEYTLYQKNADGEDEALGTYQLNFARGASSLTLKGGQSAVIRGRFRGLAYKVTQTSNSAFVTKVGSETTNIAEGAVGPVQADVTESPASVAAFTNTRKDGSLKISKTVSGGLDSDRTRVFSFAIAMLVANGNYTYNVYTGTEPTPTEENKTLTFTNGVSSPIELKHGQYAIVRGLPHNGAYTVTETEVKYTVDGTEYPLYTTSPAAATGTISATRQQTATFRNTHKTGTLTVSNQVISPLTTDETSTKYYFKVTLTENDAPVSGTYSSLTFTDGQAVFYLTGASASKAITLPVGIQYSVSAVKNASGEALVDAEYNYSVEPANNAITGTVTSANTAAFTITRKAGDLKVSKKVVSSQTADVVDAFTLAADESRVFSLTLNQSSVKDGDYTYDVYTGTDANPAEQGKTLTFTNGVSTPIELKHSQFALVKGLPKGATFTVKETADDDFQTPRDLNATVSMTQAEAEQAKADGDATAAVAEAAFTNIRKTGKLTITKQVDSTVRADMKTQPYTFYIQLGYYDAQNQFVPNGAFNGKRYSYSTNDPNARVTFEYSDEYGDAVGTLTINGIASRTVEGLPQGVVCKVWEQALDAFEITEPGPDTPALGQINNATPVTARFTNKRKGGTLVVKKTVVSSVLADMTASYRFRVTLDDTSVGDTQVDPTGKIFGSMTFKDGVAEFDVPANQTVSASGLPTGIGYKVEEISYNNGMDPAKHFVTTATKAEGTISETASADVEFTNTCAVCKITANGALLYVKDGEAYVPAAFTTLKAAFDALNTGELYDKTGVETTAEAFKVEMLVETHDLKESLTLNAGKPVTLTTASRYVSDFPYSGTGEATVKRAFEEGSMLTSNGSLTLTNITLDGNGETYTAVCDGGIVNVASGSLAIGMGATLQNSNITGKGGAVYVTSGASMTMTGGKIFRNSAAEGGAVDVGVDGQGMTAATLNFSGAPTIYDNLASDDTQRNIVLSADSATVINVIDGGLTGGKLGVYVVNDYLPSRGMRERPFATFVQGANGNPDVFKSDRNADMVGVATTDGSNTFVWSGMLQLRVCEYGDSSQLIHNAHLTLTNEHGAVVWSGDTDRNGLVRIPWKGDDEADGIDGANFSIGSSYTLRQTATDSYHTCPNGYWTLSVVDANGDEDGEEYAITFTANGDPTTPEIELVSAADAPSLLYNLYNIKVESYSIDKIWLDENGNEISQGDDRLKDLNVTFKLYRVSASTGINYGTGRTEPPAITKMTDADIGTIFPAWLDVMDPTRITVPENQDPTNYRNNYSIVLQHGSNVQVGFMPLTINGITKWYIVPSEKRANLGTFLSDGNTDGVSDLANNADFVAFSGRILKSGVDFESINNNSQIQITNTTDFGNTFKRGDILEYDEKLWVYRNDGEQTPNTPSQNGNLYYLLGGISSGSGSGGQSVIVEYGSQSDATSLEQELTTVKHYTVEAVNQAERIDASSHTTLTETGPYVIDADDSWRYAFTNLEGGYVYYAVEIAVLDDAVTDPDSAAAQAYNPTYVYDQNKDTIKVKNTTPDYVARVSNDGGNNWSYHIKLVNDSDSDTGIKQGAFNRANSLSGDVIIETLKESHDRYTLTSGFNFNNADLTSLTLRTTAEVASEGKRTILTSSGSNGDALIKTSCDTAVSNLIFEGGSNGGTVNTRRALYVAVSVSREEDPGQVTVTDCAFRNFKSSGAGGAIYATNSYKVANENVVCKIIDSTFNDCRASSGGAIFMDKGSVQLVSNPNKETSFTDCQATSGGGGAISVNGGYVVSDSGITAKSYGTMAFTNCSATANGGAVIVRYQGKITLEGASARARIAFTNCHAGNGGAVYQTKGEVVLKYVNFGALEDDTPVDGSACSATNDGGALWQKEGAVTIEGSMFYGCKAGTKDSNGTVTSAGSGGAFQISSGNVTVTDVTVKGCTATQNGGGINAKLTNYRMTTNNLNVSDCEAANGGGIYYNGQTSGNVTMTGGRIENCSATENGGGIYHVRGTLAMNGVGIAGCIAPNGNGAAIYAKDSVTLNSCLLTGSGGAQDDALNGGGVYFDSKYTLTLEDSTIRGFKVSDNGGGIYAADIEGTNNNNNILIPYDPKTQDRNTTSITANEAKLGGGIYVGDGARLLMQDGSIIANKEGGGIVPGGKNTRLEFLYEVRVGGETSSLDNKMTIGGKSVKCNVYLNQDEYRVIRLHASKDQGLKAESYIGVYVADTDSTGKNLYDTYGRSGQYFGNFEGQGNAQDYVGHIERFFSDRNPELYGTTWAAVPGNLKIYWPTYICKITDANGDLLYREWERSEEPVPAVYNKLYVATGQGSNTQVTDNEDTAFGVLNQDTPKLYEKYEDGSYSLYGGKTFNVEMLVPDYDMVYGVYVPGGKTITLTTAGIETSTNNEDGYGFSGLKSKWPAVIKRTNMVDINSNVGSDTMFRLHGTNNSSDAVSHFILKDITLDGGAVYNADGTLDKTDSVKTAKDGVIMILHDTAKVTLDSGATLQNAYSTKTYVKEDEWGGGAICLGEASNRSTLNLEEGSRIYRCGTESVGGAIYVRQGGNVNIKDGSIIEECWASEKGGAIFLWNKDTNVVNMTGGSIVNCRATKFGGAVYIKNSSTMNLSGGHITGNTVSETGNGAGIYLEDRPKGGNLCSILNISGNPDFGGDGQYTDASGNKYLIAFRKSNGVFIRYYVNAAGTEHVIDRYVLEGGEPYRADENGEKQGEALESLPLGNYREGTLDTTVDGKTTYPTNGQQTYAMARQDIFINGFGQGAQDTAVNSVRVHEKITSGDGSIWVWADEREHCEMLLQFAVFESETVKNKLDNDKTLDSTMQAFRNARDDESTGCGAGYLTGQEGDDVTAKVNGSDRSYKAIYWTGGFDFVFRKIDGDGNAIGKETDGSDGATFTLFMAVEDPNNAGSFVPAMKNASGKLVPATSTDETTWAAYEQTNPNKTVGGKVDATATSKRIASADAVKVKRTGDGGTTVDEVSVYGDGLAVFEKIPPGVYFMVEKVRTKKAGGGYDIATGAPKVDGKNVYYQAAEEMYRVVIDGKGWYTLHVAPRNADGQPVWDKAKKEDKVYTWPDAKNAPTVKLYETSSGSKAYTDNGTGTNTFDLFTALNVDACTRKVILKKVDGDTYTPLTGATFTIYYADMQTVVWVDGKNDSGAAIKVPLENLESGAAGAFWIGKLPFGTYYLVEKAAPGNYTDNAGKVFKLTVGDAAIAGTVIGDDANKPVGHLTASDLASDDAMLEALRKLFQSIRTNSTEDNPPAGTGD